jgi:hypothetical protein
MTFLVFLSLYANMSALLKQFVAGSRFLSCGLKLIKPRSNGTGVCCATKKSRAADIPALAKGHPAFGDTLRSLVCGNLAKKIEGKDTGRRTSKRCLKGGQSLAA